MYPYFISQFFFGLSSNMSTDFSPTRSIFGLNIISLELVISSIDLRFFFLVLSNQSILPYNNYNNSFH